VGAGDLARPVFPDFSSQICCPPPTELTFGYCYCAGMLRKYAYRRTLPHYQKDNKAIFATFATYHRWHLPETARDLVVEACLHIDRTKCTVHGFVVMPDHVHLVFTPLADNDGPFLSPKSFRKLRANLHTVSIDCSGEKAESGRTSRLIMFFAAKRGSLPSWSTSA
jgi:REP element-mobilizing transposase RayT